MTHFIKNASFLLMVALSSTCFAQNFTVEQHSDTFYFETNQYEIQLAKVPKLENLERIEIRGHADVRGSSSSNLELSKNRCNAVEELVTYHFPAVPIVTYAAGETESSETENQIKLAQDRKVIATYFYKIYANKEEKLAPLDPLINSIRKKPTCFTINTSKDTFIVGQEGTLVYIPKDAFDTKCKQVKFELTEFYSMEDILMNNMTTQAGSQILQTQGMLETAASDCDGRSVGLKTGKTISYKMPTELTDQSDYQFFTGERTQSHGVNWSSASAQFGFLGLGSFGGAGSCCFFWCKVRCFVRSPFKGCFRESCSSPYYDAIDRAEYDKTYAEYIHSMRKLNRNPSRENLDSFKLKYVAFHITRFNNTGIQEDEALRLLKDFTAEQMLSGDYNMHKKINALIAESNLKKKGGMTADNLNYFTVQSSDLGLVNVDRYLKLAPKNQTNLICETDQADSKKINFKLIIPSDNIMINPTGVEKKSVRFNPLGKNIRAKAIAYKIVNGTIMLAIHELVTGTTQRIKFDFKRVSLDEFKASLRLAGAKE